MPPGRPERYAGWMIASARTFGEDPFLLGALAYRHSACRPEVEEMSGSGLTSIPREMYAERLRRGIYRYKVLEGGRLRDRELRLDRFPFAGPRLVRAEENLYFAAGLLSAWRDQHSTVDGAFTQVPHRHYVSHFVWGDRVRSDRDEDRLFTDRRRLLQYYGAIDGTRSIPFRGIRLGSALDGAPRVVSSGLGDLRDDGDRSHRGIDLESTPGETVRVIAAGEVTFAGVDMPGRQSHRQLRPDEFDSVPRSALGPGGRFVCVRHRHGEQMVLRSCYMHLETVEVAAGQTLARGARIGTVGRTGMQSSAAHLHLELHGTDDDGDHQVMDGLEVLRGLVIGDPSAQPD